ncbi:nucleotidyl transferase AbiEii/AbiGii toxin family protein [Flammeovirgaceae bacterium SG7u.111]|nr:nucleotidyl transferase AbiEii/AbiGii toxin family protein [Flammeovirgaceae bacterium SG7u.132]WPO36639.1 nucleotidyl transferase AbiEii/AbiGii toxin family protein [Flammeovirgaceae bacterium SG7u.111]
MQYKAIFQSLQTHGVKYVVTGGVAVNIYGIQRMTVDLDLVVDLNAENLKQFRKVVDQIGLQTSLPIRLEAFADNSFRRIMIHQKNMIAYSFFNTGPKLFVVDVIIDMPIPFDEIWKQRETRHVEGIDIEIISIEHLIALKKESDREVDQSDIAALSKLKNL